MQNPQTTLNSAYWQICLCCTVIGLLCAHLPSHVLGQSNLGTSATGEARQVPAPWRPSFGSINKNAASNAVSSPSGQSNNPNTNSLRNSSSANSLNNSPNPLNNSFGQPGGNSANNLRNSSGNSSGKNSGKNSGANFNSGANVPIENGPGITRVTQRMDKLPNSAGQVWREYDISPYTSRITSIEDPQQAILDWILRETGTEMWFNQPLGILNANQNQLYVYHTPEIQRVVKKIVDRFVRTRGQVQRIDVNLVTVANPNWRSEAYSMLQPIDVRSAGVEAWMISKENAAILQSNLSKRVDFNKHSSGTLMNHDGQTFILEKTQPVQFVRNLRWTPNQVPSYQPIMTKIDEGYSLAISCLSSLDNNTIEATIKCDVDQVEKLSNVKINVPGAGGVNQQSMLQIPQLVSWRLHERFRWPNDQVLMLSCGVVAAPEPQGASRIPLLGKKSKRADALLFIEYRGPATGATVPQTANSNGGLSPILRRQ